MPYPVAAARNRNHNTVSGILSYGPNYPAYVTGNEATGIDWTDPEKAQGAESGDYAFCYFFSGSNSAPLRASDFGMAIPSGATIHGILVEVLRSADTNDFKDWANSGYGARLMLDAEDNGTHIGDDLGDGVSLWQRIDFEWKAYGGETELWGTTGLTAENLNSASFAFDISAVSDNSGGTVMVQAVRMTVWASG
jgi:hypothetical protein